MKLLFVLGLAVAMMGCSNDPTTYTAREMIVTPKSLTFASGVSVQNLSITHTCTCPFSWVVNVLDSTSAVLQPTNGSGDNTKVTINIDRTKLTKDTLKSFLQITSNGYGTDTVLVTVIK